MIEFFDIGNHLELAGRLRARPQFDPGIRVPMFNIRVPMFNIETNRAVYVAANGGPTVTSESVVRN